MALHWQILIAMIAASVIGVALNLGCGHHETDGFVNWPGVRVQQLGMEKPIDIPRCHVWIHDTPRRIRIQINPWNPDHPADDRQENGILGGDGWMARRIVVTADIEEAHRSFENFEWPDLPESLGRQIAVTQTIVATVPQLEEKDPAAYVLFHQHGRSMARTIGDLATTIGNLFLRMLQMVSVPLIITSLVTGITGLGKAEQLGKMFGRTILYYLVTSLLAICTGLILFNLIDPGGSQATGNPPAASPDSPDTPAGADPLRHPRAPQGKALSTVLLEQSENLIPRNPFEAITQGNFLSIIAFSLAFGICTILCGGHAAEVIRNLFGSAFEVMMTMTMYIIRLAPYGVFFLMLSATATQGLIIFGTLGLYMLTVACALLVHAGIVLPLIVRYVAKRNPWEFAKAMSPALLTAFSSASSNGTLPVTLTCVEERARISNHVGSFVLPLGATINMDGTALYEVIAVMFIANLTPGIDLSIADQIIVAYTALMASIGAAGIPHAGLVMMLIILQAVGLPIEKQGLIIAVDRVLDMCRTTVNVWSDSCGCAVISRFETDPEPKTVIQPPRDSATNRSDHR
ncbi:MAG: dicarboxylate/amino acid:cation symporter [Pirellulales bacterium]|nr:dicarboxylate/amino acid:cation symporter [Pirellulales bacterium]